MLSSLLLFKRPKHLSFTEYETRQRTAQLVMHNNSLGSLESRVDELIKECDSLRAENRAMKTQQTSLMTERATLIEKSELARTRVEAMIARLKAMEINA
jgi:cell division protein ZapB